MAVHFLRTPHDIAALRERARYKSEGESTRHSARIRRECYTGRFSPASFTLAAKRLCDFRRASNGSSYSEIQVIWLLERFQIGTVALSGAVTVRKRRFTVNRTTPSRSWLCQATEAF